MQAIKEQRPFIKMVEAARAFDEQQVVWLDELANVVSHALPGNKEVVLNKLDMYEAGRRMELKLRASDAEQGGEMVEKLESFGPEGHEGPYYAVRRGGVNKTKGDYPNEESITVRVVGRSGADGD